MKIKFIPVSLLPAAVLFALTAVMAQTTARSADAEKTFVIVANDTLKFSLTRIEASPGQEIHVELRNEGTFPKATMGHNWILLDNDSEAVPYAMAAMSAGNSGFMPKSMSAHVLASIPLLGPKETGNVTFKAPEKPGKYPFICSCSGHSMAGMRGELIVK
jgi:azurin